MTNKILPVALVAALLGGTVGALVMRPGKSSQPEVAQAVAPQNAVVAGTSATKVADGNQLIDSEIASDTRSMTQAERDAFRDGFVEGIRTARDNEVVNTRTAAVAAPVATASRATYRPAARRVARNSAPRRVYYDYGQQPRAKRSF